MEDVTFRNARSADVPRLVELLRHGALDEHKEDHAELSGYRSALAEIQATDGSDVLVAEVDGEIVAMCQLIVFRHFQRRGAAVRRWSPCTCTQISVGTASAHNSWMPQWM